MNTAKKYVIGNWKTNPLTQNDAVKIFADIAHLADNLTNCVVAIAPSFVHLPVLQTQNQKSLVLGGQDVCAYTLKTGAYTGDVSAAQLADIGAKFALVGHSERRQYHGEHDEILTKKIHQAFLANLSVIFCIGETKAEYDAGQTYEVLEKQLRLLGQFASDVGFEHHELPKLLIAYEPVWAIGTGLTPTTLEIEEVHNYISESLSTLEIYAPLLYGGSVNQNNASDIANIAVVDGVLVGGASLKADNFGQIIRAFIN